MISHIGENLFYGQVPVYTMACPPEHGDNPRALAS